MTDRFFTLTGAALALAAALTPAQARAADALATWTVSSSAPQGLASHDGTV